MTEVKLNILCPFDMIYDIDYGLLKLIVEEYNNPEYINVDYLKNVSFDKLQNDLCNQTIRDPLKLAFKEGIDYSDIYSLYETEQEKIVNNCSRLKTYNVFEAYDKYDLANIFIKCDNKYQASRVQDEAKLTVVEDDIPFDCLYIRDYKDLLNDYVKIEGKNIYIANCAYNLEIKDGVLTHMPKLEISPLYINNEISMVSIY